MKFEKAVEIVEKCGGQLATAEMIEKAIKHSLPYVVNRCACGDIPIDVAYVWITNGKMEDRAVRRPFCGVVSTPNGRYSAISDCWNCGHSQPELKKVIED